MKEVIELIEVIEVIEEIIREVHTMYHPGRC